MNLIQNSKSGKGLKLLVIITINILIGLLHFVLGRNYNGPFREFVTGYVMDIIIPFGFYFLLIAAGRDIKIFNNSYISAVIVLLASFTVEMLQKFGYHVLGSTFDILDFGAYFLGVCIAVICDRILFPKVFPFWENEMKA